MGLSSAVIEDEVEEVEVFAPEINDSKNIHKNKINICIDKYL